MFCENCGRQIADDAKICPACGKVVMVVMPTVQSDAVPAQNTAVQENTPMKESFVPVAKMQQEPVEKPAEESETAEISWDDINAELDVMMAERKAKRIKCYAMIDIRVYLMALVTKNTESAVVQLWNAVTDGRIAPVYCADKLEEYEELLRRDKFKLPDSVVSEFMNTLKTNGIAAGQSADGKAVVDTNGLPFYEVIPQKTTDMPEGAVTSEELMTALQ